MSPGKLTTRPADKAWARGRRKVGDKYLEVAGVVDTEDGEAINVCVDLLTLAGIAAGMRSVLPPSANATPDRTMRRLRRCLGGWTTSWA